MTPTPVVAISAIEHFSYCARQCALIHCDGVWADNAHTVRGSRAHRRVDSGQSRKERGKLVLRAIPLWSEELGLSGRADAVEIDGETVRPIEYKAGTPHGAAANLQLCAQGLCLEEMLGVDGAEGYLSTLYVRDHRARVRHRRGSLLVVSPTASQRVPLEAIDAVVMLGHGQITSQAMEACVTKGVRVTALRRGGGVRFVVGRQTGGNVHLRTALHEAVADYDHSLSLSKAIVAAKVQNSRKVIDRWARDAKDPAMATDLGSRTAQILARVPLLAAAANPNALRGIEGDVARIYFRGMRHVLTDHKEVEMRHPVLGRRVGRWALPSVQATLLARHLRGDLPAYPAFVMA